MRGKEQPRRAAHQSNQPGAPGCTTLCQAASWVWIQSEEREAAAFSSCLSYPWFLHLWLATDNGKRQVLNPVPLVTASRIRVYQRVIFFHTKDYLEGNNILCTQYWFSTWKCCRCESIHILTFTASKGKPWFLLLCK